MEANPNLESMKNLPMARIRLKNLENKVWEQPDPDEGFLLGDNYRPDTIAVVYWEETDELEPDAYVVRGDLDDAIEVLLEESEDRERKIQYICFVDKFEVKNYNGDPKDLVWAALEAWTIPDDRNAEEIGEEALVEIVDTLAFTMDEWNHFGDEIKMSDFDKLWNEQ